MIFIKRQPFRFLREGVLTGAICLLLVVVYNVYSVGVESRRLADGKINPENTKSSPLFSPLPPHAHEKEEGKDDKHNILYEESDKQPTAKPQSIDPRNHTRTLVIARTKSEDVSWIHTELGDELNLKTAIYTVDDDDPAAQYRVPKNKGHEVMVYFTYIIEHYDTLSDVTMFMHSHLTTWHNNDLLDSSAALIIKRLSTQRVTREGYMNMRCHWGPGCPDHLHPFSTTASDNGNQPEEVIFANSWLEIFPNTTVPLVLSQPCCAQFALSKDKIRSIAKEKYIYYRNWVLESKLPDNLSGRVWEYLWQVIFAGVNEFCPKEHLCYCDGYGVCFGGEREYEHWFDLRQLKTSSVTEREKVRKANALEMEGKLNELEDKIKDLDREMEELKQKALKNGMDPEFRAREAGRKWSPGDGF